jgi:hypothetical protein
MVAPNVSLMVRRRHGSAVSNHEVYSVILRDAARWPLLPSERKRAHPGMRLETQFSFSIAIATPCPTPTHMVASARLSPRFSMPCTAVNASRAPLMPRG